MGELVDLAKPAPPAEMLDVETGQLVSRADLPGVVGLYKKVDDFERQITKAKRWCRDAILEQMDARAEYTLHLGGVTVTGDNPTATDIQWDIAVLMELEPLLPRDRFLELVKQTVVYKADTHALHRAAKAGGEVQAIIERAEGRTPKKHRYVQVRA